jgi:hypothetical protein
VRALRVTFLTNRRTLPIDTFVFNFSLLFIEEKAPQIGGVYVVPLAFPGSGTSYRSDVVPWMDSSASRPRVLLALCFFGCPVFFHLDRQASRSVLRAVQPLGGLVVPAESAFGFEQRLIGAEKRTWLEPRTVGTFVGTPTRHTSN